MTDSWEDYRRAQAEAWLSKVRRAVRSAAELRRQAQAQYEAADGLRGMDYSRVTVSASHDPDAIERAVIAHMEVGDSLSAISEAAEENAETARRSLSRMSDEAAACCLTMYYVDGAETWTEVADAMGYGTDGMMKLRKRALALAYDVMPHSEREALHQAL